MVFANSEPWDLRQIVLQSDRWLPLDGCTLSGKRFRGQLESRSHPDSAPVAVLLLQQHSRPRDRRVQRDFLSTQLRFEQQMPS